VTRCALTRFSAAALLVAAGACIGERERLDVPRLTLEVLDSTVTPGGAIQGSVTATDASGLSSVVAYACTRDSIFQHIGPVYNHPSAVEFSFALPVSHASAEGDSVVVLAVAFDDQGFDAETAFVAFVRGSAVTTPPEGDGLSRCLPASQARLRRGTITSPLP
jgi:hypothetical protein